MTMVSNSKTNYKSLPAMSDTGDEVKFADAVKQSIVEKTLHFGLYWSTTSWFSSGFLLFYFGPLLSKQQQQFAAMELQACRISSLLYKIRPISNCFKYESNIYQCIVDVLFLFNLNFFKKIVNNQNMNLNFDISIAPYKNKK